MKKGKFETVLAKFIPESSKEWTGVHFALLSAAESIDNTREQLIRDAEYMARKFSAFAVEVGPAVAFIPTPPTNYSTINDITANARGLQVAQESFYTLLGSVLGPDVKKEFIRSLAE